MALLHLPHDVIVSPAIGGRRPAPGLNWRLLLALGGVGAFWVAAGAAVLRLA